jgi:hypothetical protein
MTRQPKAIPQEHLVRHVFLQQGHFAGRRDLISILISHFIHRVLKGVDGAVPRKIVK